MSAAFNRLEQAAAALDAALAADDIPDILTATTALKTSVAAVGKAAPASLPKDARPLIERILQLLESAQGRVNFLSDLTQRRLDVLHAARGMAPATYGRPR